MAMDISQLLSIMNSWNQLPAWTQTGNDRQNFTPPDPNSGLAQAGERGSIIATIQNMLNNLPAQIFQQTQTAPPPPPPPAGPADNSFLRSILNQQGADPSSIPAAQQYPDNVQAGLAQQGQAGQTAGQQPPYVPLNFTAGGGGAANFAMQQAGYGTTPSDPSAASSSQMTNQTTQHTPQVGK